MATGGTDTAPVPRFPVLAGACDTGRVGERQAAIVIEQLQALPGDLTGTQRARAEEVLAAIWRRRVGWYNISHRT